MKTHLFLFALGLSCLLNLSDAACDLTKRQKNVPFPDITKSVADSYIMGVEYSVPKSAQTDYYTEYYEMLFKRGRVESHIKGENPIYIYQSETWEAWTLQNNVCTLNNITVVPDFFKDAQTDWLHYGGSTQPRTIGPSAMFKVALDAWNNTANRGTKMAYMGDADGYIRGEKAVYWRRCLDTGGYADYYFANSEEDNAYDSDSLPKFSPLRVHFIDVVPNSPLGEQVYDIISFQPYIPKGVEPFQLPKGKNCGRGDLVDGPKLPDFSKNSLLLYAEVVYQKFNKDNELMSGYYSTLSFALDLESQHLAYYYAPWNTTKPGQESKEPFVDAPEYVIYDMKHLYTYRINYETAKCEISRDRSFIPEYKLPENGGKLALTDPYVLFPNSELKFSTEGKDRGLGVNIFEAEIKNYNLDKDTVIPRAIVSHSYLKFNEELENTVAVRNAPTQMEFRFFRNDDVQEVLTLNIFGFTTRIPNRRYMFDVTRCYKNDDDYLFLTIGFEIENQYLKQIEKVLPEIERNVASEVRMKSELNPVRMPSILTDLRENYVYVTMIVLGKPPLMLDFIDVDVGKTIKTSSPDDVQGVSDFDTCANNCLEDRSNCWAFSMCGATCYYGSEKNTVIETSPNCTLYRRYSNETYIMSKESQANNVVRQVEAGEFKIIAVIGDEHKTLTATVAEITNPAEDDSMFEKMGNFLNPRMRVVKAGSKLKKGSTIKNLGKLRYDECQSLCLDFKSCETLSYCLKSSECIVSTKYDSDLTADDKETNDLCILLARKYGDHFDRTPGVFVEAEVGTKKEIDNDEDCARACLKETSFKCLSFDHCAGEVKKGCSLYKVHYLKPEDRKASVTGKAPRCGHYTRKFSTEFKRKDQTRTVGTKVPSITNLTLEECAKTCVDYNGGSCYGYDFCQDKTLYATSCTILDSDPSEMQTSYSPICTHYLNAVAAKKEEEEEQAPHSFSNSYAGGIGFVCFLVGGVIGAIVVFVIAYIKANRG